MLSGSFDILCTILNRRLTCRSAPRPFGYNYAGIPWVLDFVYYIME